MRRRSFLQSASAALVAILLPWKTGKPARVADNIAPSFTYEHTVFVNSLTGSDRNDGREPGRALATVNRALIIANAGDTILLSPGPYVMEVRHYQGA